MSTLAEIASVLQTAGVGTLGTDLYIGQMPDEPTVCTGVFEYKGLPPLYVFGQATIHAEFPRIQIVCRGDNVDYETPRATAETAFRAIAQVANQVVSGTRYIVITPLQSPFNMGKDANERILIGFNCQVQKELSA